MKHLQNLGKALMGAVAVLPVAALLMGIGYYIDPNGWGGESIYAGIFIGAGAAILDHLGLIFAIAIAFGLSKDKSGAAALSGLVGMLTVTTIISAKSVLTYRTVAGMFNGVKEPALAASEGWHKMNDNNVLLGILVGIMAAVIYNKCHKIELPAAFSFFSGRRLVPILTAFAAIALSGALYILWPILFGALFSFAKTIEGMGALGAGIYAFFNRLLIPTGLHHALNSIFWTNVGLNDIGRFLGGATTLKAEGPGIIGTVGMYQAGFFPIMMFGLPAAALAMYQTAKPARKKAVGSLMLAGAVASIVTGVTEPIEFSFMFMAPPLYLVHALLTGISVFISAAMQWIAGFGFSAGAIDMVLSVPNPLAVQWYMLLVQGVVFGIIYYAIFRFAIPAFNIKTPGREDEEDNVAEDVVAAQSALGYAKMAEIILAGLGGKENIDEMDYCITRLRLTVKDNVLVKENEIKKAQIAGIIRPSQKTVQVIVGTKVQFVYDEFKKLVES